MIRSPLILLNRPRVNLGSTPVPPLPAPIQQALSFLGIAHLRRPGQAEEHILFASHGALAPVSSWIFFQLVCRHHTPRLMLYYG
jgi:hypothetical protein